MAICVAPYLYEDKLQELIVNFKFYHKPQYGTFFGNKLAEAVCDKGMESMCEVVVSVPISKERLKERGYNQSELIAKNNSRMSGDSICKLYDKNKAQFRTASFTFERQKRKCERCV